MKVEFIEVGRDKKTWTAEIKTDEHGLLLEELMFKAVRRHLASSDIGFSDEGEIIVGGWRVVGRWRVIEEAQAEQVGRKGVRCQQRWPRPNGC